MILYTQLVQRGQKNISKYIRYTDLLLTAAATSATVFSPQTGETEPNARRRRRTRSDYRGSRAAVARELWQAVGGEGGGEGALCDLRGPAIGRRRRRHPDAPQKFPHSVLPSGDLKSYKNVSKGNNTPAAMENNLRKEKIGIVEIFIYQLRHFIR